MSEVPELFNNRATLPRNLTLAEYITGYGDMIASASQRLAKSFLLPDTLRTTAKDAPEVREQKIRDCGVLLARCLSTGEDFMALAQSIYMVGGRPSLAAAYLVARAQQIGAIRGAPRCVTSGTWPDIEVSASVVAADGNTYSTTVSMQEAREDGWASRNPKYTHPKPAENMLRNRARARLIREVCPGVILGMSCTEELEDAPPMVVTVERTPPKVLPDPPRLDVAPASPPPIEHAPAEAPSIELTSK